VIACALARVLGGGQLGLGQVVDQGEGRVVFEQGDFVGRRLSLAGRGFWLSDAGGLVG